MATTLVIHIFHDDESSLSTSSHVAERIREVQNQRGIALEVYVFGPAQKAIAAASTSASRDTLIALAKAGVPVHTCRNTAEATGTVEKFAAMGIELEYARDAFVRYALEGATVISF